MSLHEVLRCLEAVEEERRLRDADAGLRARVTGVKAFQQRRFEASYRDLLASPRFGPAARFFLDDLYGPTDFRQRDIQFARIVPQIDRLFPAVTTEVVVDLAQLHALSENLDTAMARVMQSERPDAAQYVTAWLEVGRRHDRERQLELVMEIGQALERLTRHAWLVTALKMMRRPARAAGLVDLQQFLERGLDSFRSMRGASEFLAVVEAREKQLMRTLFEGDLRGLDAGSPVRDADSSANA